LKKLKSKISSQTPFKGMGVYCVSLSDGDLLIGPCRLQRPRTTARDQTGQGDPGTKGIIRKEEPGPRTCSVNARVLNPFFQERQVTRSRVQPPSPLPPSPFRAAWAGTHYPPPQSIPLPQKNCHLGSASVKTSLRPPNLNQKSQFGHKTTELSISG
jgi:hypothetical protein